VALSYSSARLIRVAINGKITNGTFIIYDASGRATRSYAINTADAGSALNINLSGYSSGIYLYRLVSDRGTVSNGKLVLK